MNKNELIKAVAEATNLTQKDVKAAVEATFATVEAALAKGEKVQLIGFGTFETRKQAARVGKNPKTKEPVDIPECTKPAFKAGKALKDAVNK